MDEVLTPQRSSGGGSATMFKMSRKFMWASCLCTMAITLQLVTHRANALPVLASSLGSCLNVPIKADPNPLDCCLPAPVNTPKPFKLPVNPSIRERKPVHVLSTDPEYVRKYNLAYKLMRELPAGDPRSWDAQWKIHCSFCNEAFLQRMLPAPAGPDNGVPLQVHYSWLFLPWHRMLIYFHEKILGSLINDPTFALPFWNWDNQLADGANQIPSLFLPGFPMENSALLDANRNTKHFPPIIMPLSYDSKQELLGTAPNRTKQEIIDDNLCVLYNQVVNKVSAREFLGGPYVIGSDFSVSSVAPNEIVGEPGGAENIHDIAHEWVGFINDDKHPDNEDLGTFIYSGKDPIFYTHHTNMDRLWDIWKTLPDTVSSAGDRKRQDYEDEDFLNSEFTFYDENAEMVIVKVKDTLDSAKFGYTYTRMTESDNLWIQHKPKSSVPAAAKMAAESWQPSDYPEVDAKANNTISDVANCYKVSRRAPNETDLIGKSVKRLDELSEQVLMEQIQIPHTCYVRFDAYIDQPSANTNTALDQADYIGTFTHLPSGLVNTSSSNFRQEVIEDKDFRTINVRFSITTALARLGITDYNTDITVTIVPRMRMNGTTTLTFKSLKQEFL